MRRINKFALAISCSASRMVCRNDHVRLTRRTWEGNIAFCNPFGWLNSGRALIPRVFARANCHRRGCFDEGALWGADGLNAPAAIG